MAGFKVEGRFVVGDSESQILLERLLYFGRFEYRFFVSDLSWHLDFLLKVHLLLLEDALAFHFLGLLLLNQGLLLQFILHRVYSKLNFAVSYIRRVLGLCQRFQTEGFHIVHFAICEFVRANL